MYLPPSFASSAYTLWPTITSPSLQAENTRAVRRLARKYPDPSKPPHNRTANNDGRISLPNVAYANKQSAFGLARLSHPPGRDLSLRNTLFGWVRCAIGRIPSTSAPCAPPTQRKDLEDGSVVRLLLNIPHLLKHCSLRQSVSARSEPTYTEALCQRQQRRRHITDNSFRGFKPIKPTNHRAPPLSLSRLLGSVLCPSLPPR